MNAVLLIIKEINYKIILKYSLADDYVRFVSSSYKILNNLLSINKTSYYRRCTNIFVSEHNSTRIHLDSKI